MMSTLPIYKKVGLFASIGASVLMVLSLYLGGNTAPETFGRFMADAVSVIAVILLIAAMVTGGIVDAFGISLKAARIAWHLCPFWIVDLVVALTAGLFTFLAMMILPIIPFIVNCRRYAYGD